MLLGRFAWRSVQQVAAGEATRTVAVGWCLRAGGAIAVDDGGGPRRRWRGGRAEEMGWLLCGGVGGGVADELSRQGASQR